MNLFTDADFKQIEAAGKSVEAVEAEIGMFRRGAPFLKLDRPAVIGDGIRLVGMDEARDLVKLFTETAAEKELLKFVPASGAASRMFKFLLEKNNSAVRISQPEAAAMAAAGDPAHQELVVFMQGIKKFAFFADLKRVMAATGLDFDLLIGQGEFKEIIDCLLTAKGLNYAERPKGLLKFHQYRADNRTAFAEHLAEAVAYARGSNDEARLHFTVSPEHQAGFNRLAAEIKEQYEDKFKLRFVISFSIQEKSTDTIAVDLENRPFRNSDGSLLFRPGGHGALLANLNRLSADIIFIKNIDNVVPEDLQGETSFWKRVLGGLLLKLQNQIFSYLQQLHRQSVNAEIIKAAADFIENELVISIPESFAASSDAGKIDLLLNILDRPLRVCGMVENQGEPGGGPFWVEGSDGSLSLQIVEGVQVDPESSGQQAILSAATHFNPVDLVCGVRNWRGEAFDLNQYVDYEAVFISRKSKEGRELKALELPGIWNGAMAFWNTIFIEVPLLTFNPVKTVNDLLRPEHQA